MKKMLARQPRLFYRILILCVLLVAVVTLLISTILYVNFEQAIISKNAKFIQDNLEKASNSAVFMSDWASTLAVQMLYDNDIIKMLNYPAVEQQEVIRFRNRIGFIRQSSPYIASIYIYNGKEKKIYSDIGNSFGSTREAFFDQGVFDLLDNMIPNQHLRPIPRLMQYTLNGRPAATAEVYTFVLFDDPNRRTAADNAIILNVSRQWLDNAIRSLDKSTSSSMIIVDSHSRVVYGGGTLRMLADLSADDAIASVQTKSDPAGYVLFGRGDSRQLITWVRGTGKQADWIYLYRLPAASLTGDISKMQQATVAFSAMMLLIGLAGSFGYTIYVYRPIHTMQDRLTRLEKENVGSQAVQQQEFLRSLLCQDGMELAAVAQEMKHLELPFDAAAPVSIGLFALDGYARLEQDYSYEKRQKANSAIARIIAGQGGNGPVAVVEMEAGQFILFLHPDPDGECSMGGIAEAVQKKVKAALGLTISAVIGAAAVTWDRLPAPYKTLRSNLTERVFLGPECVIELSALKRLPTSGYDYPVQKEKQMCQMIMLRQTPEALQCCMDIIGGARSYGGNMLQVILLRITSAVMELTDKLNNESGAHVSYDYDAFLSGLNKLESLAEISCFFETMLHSIADQLNYRKATYNKELIDSIVMEVKTRYADPMLTIDTFASDSNLSGIHLARLFRRYVGESFSDHLRKLRLAHACSLISETSDSMQRIAEKVGFANANHFYTLFRKEYGITPADFRQQHKQDKQSV